MNLSGLGVLIIGIAAVIAAVGIGRLLLKATKLVGSIDRSITAAPRQLEGIMTETCGLISEGNQALADLNIKTSQLNPYFYLLGDLGRGCESWSLTLKDKLNTLDRKSLQVDEKTEEMISKNGYGSIMLAYFLMKKRKEMQRIQEGV